VAVSGHHSNNDRYFCLAIRKANNDVAHYYKEELPCYV